MPEARLWTEAADRTILEMRAQGVIWAQIGRTLGLSRNTVIERGHRLRAEAPVRVVVAQEETISDDPNRLPLRPGHPVTWGILWSNLSERPCYHSISEGIYGGQAGARVVQRTVLRPIDYEHG